MLQVITRLVRRGASKHVVDLARSLDPDRFEVEILAGRGEPYEGSLWDEAEATGLQCHRVDSLQRRISPLADAKAFASIVRVMRRGRFDVVHTHISKSGLLGRLAARRAGVPVTVHTYHGVPGELVGRGVSPRVLRSCECRCARVTDGCIAISRGVATELETAGIARPGTCTVIRNGIDLEACRKASTGARPAQMPPAPVIGTVGSLTPEKGTEVLLRAAAVLCRAHRDLRVCIVGDGPRREALESLARGLRIAERVTFAGVVDNALPWIAAFDVFVLPSRSEGMGLTLIEAMALGCPIVATEVGGVREAVGDAGLLVASHDPEELAAAVGRVLTGSGLRRRLVEAGHSRSRGFTLAEMAARTGELYESLLMRKTGRRR